MRERFRERSRGAGRERCVRNTLSDACETPWSGCGLVLMSCETVVRSIGSAGADSAGPRRPQRAEERGEMHAVRSPVHNESEFRAVLACLQESLLQ